MIVERNQRYEGIVVQSFRDEDEAERAVRRLTEAGFSADQVSVVAKDRERAQAVADDTGADVAEGAGIGALTGGVLGGAVAAVLGATALAIPGIGVVVAGPLAAILGGAGIGALGGGLAGALAALGVSEDESRYYQERFESGEIIVTVAAGAREDEARRLLQGGTSDYGYWGRESTSVTYRAAPES